MPCFSSYDETDEDCLSPNVDDVTTTEVIEDSSVEDSTLSEGVSSIVSNVKGPVGAVSRQPATTASSAFVNLSSIYSIGNANRWPNAESAPNNGMSEKKTEKPIPPEKPVSLTMMNGKVDNRYGFNNSFLYSQLLSPNSVRARDPPSYTAATSAAADRAAELKKVTSPTKSNKSPIGSPVNGVNKISDNYERAIAERLSPQKEISRLNRSSLFSKVNTGVVSGKLKKSTPRTQEEEDEDYARDSDECSI